MNNKSNGPMKFNRNRAGPFISDPAVSEYTGEEKEVEAIMLLLVRRPPSWNESFMNHSYNNVCAPNAHTRKYENMTGWKMNW